MIAEANSPLVADLRQRLRSIPYIQLVEDASFDLLLRGSVSVTPTTSRLLTPVGDATKLGNARSSTEVIDRAGPLLEYAYVLKTLVGLRPEKPAFKIAASVLGDRRDFRLGEKLVFDITSEEDCYILLFNLDSTANLHLVFPNEYSRENLLKAGTRIELPNESMRKGRFSSCSCRPREKRPSSSLRRVSVSIGADPQGQRSDGSSISPVEVR